MAAGEAVVEAIEATLTVRHLKAGRCKAVGVGGARHEARMRREV